MAESEHTAKPVTITEVKNILKKIEKDRKELLYEQKTALEHAHKFAKLPTKKVNDMVKELSKLDYIQEIHAYKIADILPSEADDVKTIFAKERISLGENEIKKILEIVQKYYVE
jgi:DNA-directed RNA polymerase subunit F